MAGLALVVRRLITQGLLGHRQPFFLAIGCRAFDLEQLLVRTFQARLQSRDFASLRRHDIAQILYLALVVGQKYL